MKFGVHVTAACCGEHSQQFKGSFVVQHGDELLCCVPVEAAVYECFKGNTEGSFHIYLEGAGSIDLHVV